VPEAGNYFVTGDDSSFGIYMYGAGADNVVSMNKFGMHTDGSDATLWKGIHLYNTTCRIDDNEFVGAIHSGIGVDTSTDYTSPTIARNIFRKCEWGVHIYPKGKANLGNLANSRTRDDGGNTFRLSNTWHIQNHSPYRIRAEGNDFRTTVGAEINEKLWDQRDNAALGKVDFSPLEGGVRPSGDVEGLLSIIGAAVAPTTAGAQITFTLTADASVTARVLNIAGRPAKTLCTARDSQTGANTLLWNARTDSGLAAPNGTYLVEVIASSDDGSQARAVAPVRLAR